MNISKSTLIFSSIFDSKPGILTQSLWIATFVMLIALGAQIEIPNQPIPFTLQSFFLLLAASLLGPRNGFIALSAYLFLGIIGAPVFSGGSFGMTRILGPTGGYLLSFPFAAALVGYCITLRKGLLWNLFSMFLGMLIIFSSGTLFLQAFYLHDWKTAMQSGFLIFSWWDVLKIGGAAMIYTEIAKKYSRL